MIKEEVFRSRGDISAWADKHFSATTGISIESSCFMTPHYLLNLIRWDMCSSRGKTEFSAKDIKVLGVKQADALAFFALQSTKPEFMLTKEARPTHKQVCSKTIHDGDSIKFFTNFGSSSDSGTLHHRFKESLRQVKEAQKLYIADRLEHLADRVVHDIAIQLLDDSARFVAEMLEFIEDLYQSCNDSFGATTEAWELVCHCLEELFTKQMKPSLKFVVSDLQEPRRAGVGVIHAAFSLNVKVRELLFISLKNHHSTTNSHVRFVMKMAKKDKKDDKSQDLVKRIEVLEKEKSELASHLRGLESRIDKLVNESKKWKGSQKERDYSPHIIHNEEIQNEQSDGDRRSR